MSPSRKILMLAVSCWGLISTPLLAGPGGRAKNSGDSQQQIAEELNLLKMTSRAMEDGDFAALMLDDLPKELRLSARMRAWKHAMMLLRAGLHPSFLAGSRGDSTADAFANLAFMAEDVRPGDFSTSIALVDPKQRVLETSSEFNARSEWEELFPDEEPRRMKALTMGVPLGLVTAEITDHADKIRKPKWLTGSQVGRNYLDRLQINAQQGQVVETVLANDLDLHTADLSVIELAYQDLAAVDSLREFLAKYPKPLVSLVLRQEPFKAAAYPLKPLFDLLRSKSVQKLRRLTLKLSHISGDAEGQRARRDLILTLESLALPALEHLEIAGGGLSLEDLNNLLRAPWVAKLKTLTLTSQKFYAIPEDLSSLESLRSLRAFRCSWCAVDDASLMALTAHLPDGLQHLNLSHNHISQNGLKTFFQQAAVRLHSFIMVDNQVTSAQAFAAAAAANPRFADLRVWGINSSSMLREEEALNLRAWESLQWSPVAKNLRVLQTSQRAIEQEFLRVRIEKLFPGLEVVMAPAGDSAPQRVHYIVQPHACQLMR